MSGHVFMRIWNFGEQTERADHQRLMQNAEA
jgi:hypothetical protein